jgi:transcriptional regulator with XRE-family HTH domain
VHNDPKALFGKRVRELRSKMGVSQEALGDSAGVHRTSIGSIERWEKNIGLLRIVRIEKPLRVPEKELLSDQLKRLVF